MSRACSLVTAVAVAALCSSAVANCTLSAARSDTFDATGIDTVQLQAGAGELNVVGDADATSVDLEGLACASNRSLLDRVRIDVERDGSILIVDAVPESGFLQSSRLDLDVRLPERVIVDIDDRSGDVHVAGVSELKLRDRSGDVVVEGILGNVRIDQDSSGDLSVTDAGGDVTIVEDASGDIELRGVRGSVVIQEDRSGDVAVHEVAGIVRIEKDSAGGLRITDVDGDVTIVEERSGDNEVRRIGGSVTVIDDGSGGITVEAVGGDLTVEEAGSGAVRYSDVAESVRVPSD